MAELNQIVTQLKQFWAGRTSKQRVFLGARGRRYHWPRWAIRELCRDTRLQAADVRS